MGVEQAIFTVCESGIARSGAGLQVYSYSSGMETILDTTDASVLFQYEAPHERRHLNGAKTGNPPKKYAYLVVDERRPLVGFASSHALSDPREGSYFSQILVTGILSVTRYPCEYCESPLFIEGLSKQERENSDRPEYLNKITRLKEGSKITYESVRKFLLARNRLNKLKKLCAALLSGKKGEADKQIIIIDIAEDGTNRAMYWIAAMTMVLPLTTARRVSFSDYEYEPLASPYRICGTMPEGVRIQKKDAEERAYVFDFARDKLAFLHTDEELLDVFELCFRVSKECIEPFYEFIKRYRYEGCDQQLYDAYELYKLVTVRDYMTKMTKNRLHQALSFAERYAGEEERRLFTERMLSFLTKSQVVEGRILKEVLWYLKIQQEKGRVAREKLYLPVLSILYETFKRATTEEQPYRSVAREAAYFFEQTGTSLYHYYLGYLPKKETQLLFLKTTDQWKLQEGLAIIREYLVAVNPSITEVAEDEKLNALLSALIIRTSNTCISGKAMEIEQMWKAFLLNSQYATYFYLLIEHLYRKKAGEEKQCLLVRMYYAAYYWALGEEERYEASRYLIMEEEGALVRLFHYRYERRSSYKEWFEEVVAFIEKNEIYGGSLLDALMQECFENAVSDRSERYEAVFLLFQHTFRIGYQERFVNRLVPYLSAGIPLVVSKEEEVTLIRRLYYYQVNFNGGQIEKRVALSYRLYELRQFLESKPKKREKILFEKKVVIPTMDGAETEHYIKRAGRIIGEIIFQNGQVSLIHDCYQLFGDKEQLFLHQVYSVLLQKGRRKRNYMMFLHAFVYTMEEGRTELLAEAIKESMVKVDDITDQLTLNRNHLAAYKKVLDKGADKPDKITSFWLSVVKRVLKPE